MPLEDSKAVTSPAFLPQIAQRFQTLIWTCLDFDLVRSAVFYAERYLVIDENNHDARHLYATALLRSGQPHSGLQLVSGVQQSRCSGCLEIKGKCCAALGRHRLAREAFDASLQDPTYTPTASMGPRTSRAFPEEAATRCRSGTMAMKGSLPEQATCSFRQALALNPMLWEAFEGLCSLGTAPEVDEIFPMRPVPVKQGPPEEPPPTKAPSGPTATGAGFFTPDITVNTTLFRGRKNVPQAFRMDPPLDPRDSIATNEPFFHTENSFLQPPARNSKLEPAGPGPSQSAARPLSSADETGPAQKRLRSTIRQKSTETIASKPSKLTVDETSKKPVISSRTTAVGGITKNERGSAAVAPRRSTRLLSGTISKPPKHPPPRDRRRQLTTSRSRSIDSDGEDDANLHGEVASSTSPTSNAQSPPSETSPAPSNWTAANELAAQEAYDSEMADHYVYDLLRRFARATRALSKYDCYTCLMELDQIPTAHQQSSWVLAMVGRAHYEQLEYASAERAFRAARALEPYRLGDMEVYSTLLWHLQQNVQLSYLAQELMNINPRSPEAWIAVGNLFSLQKERSQALTCFRRAAEMDPSCAYAYTLSGHESIDEDLDKAIGFFQTAIRADPRHYNAWYGLGTCYLRMSKIRLAEYHYRKAVEIHPNNAVLLGCVGMAVERRGDKVAAHSLFDQAVRVAPDNALVRYRRAKILISMKRYAEALEDLVQLRDSSPEESNVVFQIAKVYRLTGDEVNSARSLAIARDTSPKSVNKLKKLIDTVKDEEGRDDQMDEG
ncbi:uncharacterized protein EDB91DRAFT_1092788 [Suillus paluster]|uniref:uncharacterized protein n=1 Tax=Suillus paluster TaxID=48578 RepID=UPI001B87C775|nr:uncharacterized protein EDB91DRAFT_1092788 [Suillus paluster]KAG1756463.1 hypothetical protein EDB91DRAFT_1092788 [Suillus paluster]